MGVLIRRSALPLALISVLSLALTWDASPGAAAAPGLPHYDHVFLIVEENHGFSQIIGNKDAPNLNALATKYGLATRYFGVSNPSLPNYLAMLGGSTFNVADDNAYWFHLLHQPSLLSQLEAAKLTWKGYFQSMPYAGFQGDCYPVRCVGMPDQDPLYAVKHNAMPYFASVSGSASERAKMTPLPQLSTDLAAGRIPNFGYVIPDECHDMHGSPPDCVDSGPSRMSGLPPSDRGQPRSARCTTRTPLIGLARWNLAVSSLPASPACAPIPGAAPVKPCR